MAGKEEKLNMSGSEESLSQVPEGDEDPKVAYSYLLFKEKEVLISA